MLTVITPVHKTAARFLPELASVLIPALDQYVPGRWSWRVQCDGADVSDISDWLPNWSVPHNTVVGYNGAQMRTPLTRNMALAYTDTEFVMTIDADDVPIGQSIARRLEVLCEDASVGFVAGGFVGVKTPRMVPPFFPLSELPAGVDRDTVDALLHLPGMPVPPDGWWWVPSALPEFIPPGGLDAYARPAGWFGLLGTSGMFRTEAVLRVGGFPAVPSGDDLAVLVAISSLYAGVVLDFPTLVYRPHEGQNTKGPRWNSYNEVSWRLSEARRKLA